ncbi:MAG: helix-turn-helix transcriptional regulator [Leptolyngbyaceae cyanobacterium]
MLDVKPPTQSPRQTIALQPIAAAHRPQIAMFAPESVTIAYLPLVFETLLDKVFPSRGFMLLDHQGKLLQSSPYARQLCRAMHADGNGETVSTPQLSLPMPVQTLADCLVESRQLFPEHRVQLQDNVLLPDRSRLCLQAEWMELEPQAIAGIVLTLDNLTEKARQQALVDAQRYRLTERERQVWEHSLLGLSYEEIGRELFITLNTVKQHLKSIRRKQEDPSQV